MPLALDDEGVTITGRHAAAILTPAHQFPLGVLLSARRRAAAVEWAADTGGLLVEDDYDGEFRYDRQAVGALQALAPDHVVYCGTASKTLAPGLRLAWMVSPLGLSDDLAEAKRYADWGSSVFDQLTLAEYMRSGAYDRHVRRCRLLYRRRRDALLDVLRRAGLEVTGIAAGMHLLALLPPGRTEAEVVADAHEHGLALDGLGSYRRNPGPSSALVLGYGTPPDHLYSGALARLSAVL